MVSAEGPAVLRICKQQAVFGAFDTSCGPDCNTAAVWWLCLSWLTSLWYHAVYDFAVALQ